MSDVHPTAQASAALALTALLCACSAGTPRETGASSAPAPEPSLPSPPLDPGHGSTQDVLTALEAQGVPCLEPRPSKQAPEGLEQAAECDLQPIDEVVLVVHFFDVAGARAFEAAEREAGRHGVYADVWAARTQTAEAAALLAAAVQNRGWA